MKNQKSLTVLLLIHPELNPLKQGLAKSKHVDSNCKTESHVYSTLKSLGHKPEFLELEDNLDPLMERVNQGGVDLVFNLLEELGGEAKFDFHAVSYLESRGIKFTGSGPRALILTRDKSLAKMIVSSLGVQVPKQTLVRTLSEIKKVEGLFPAFVKINAEDASLGLSPRNRVTSVKSLETICRKLFQLTKSALLVEEFIPGQDVSVGLIGNSSLVVLPTRRLSSPNSNWTAGEKVKTSSKVRLAQNVRSEVLIWKSKSEKQKFEAQAKSIYKELGLRGYGRLDFRLSPTGQMFFLEANANPDLSKDEDFGLSARASGLSYSELISKIVGLSGASR